MRILKRLLILIVLAAAVFGAYRYWKTAIHPYESTENTYLKAHMSLISPRESGYVKSVNFENNQAVKPGDLLVVIDDADFKAAIAEGEARIQVERAQIKSLETDKRVQESRIIEQQAGITKADADVEKAAKDLKRFGNLVKEGAVSTQTHDAADAALKQARAERDKMGSAHEQAQRQLDGYDARVAEAQARIKSIEASLQTARIALGHTRIYAPIAGVIGNRSVQVGQLVKPGLVLAFLIPDKDVFVEANFKETQIEYMHPGQPVDIEIDAFPDQRYQGRVDSFAPASGSEFSLLPPENATGNFTKIVRRVPVKITFEPGTDVSQLRPGLSATAKVRVHASE